MIVTSFNRNFPARNDGNKNTLAFIGSPETVVGMALSGRLDGSFLDEFDPPIADDLPSRGFDRGATGFVRAGRRPGVGRGRGRARIRIGSNCSSRSRRGTATTSTVCACC